MIGRFISSAVIILVATFIVWVILVFIVIFGYKIAVDVMAGWENPADQDAIRWVVGTFLIVLDIVLVIALFVTIGDSRKRRKQRKRWLEDRVGVLEAELAKSRTIEDLEAELDKSRKADPYHDPLR